MFEKLFFYNSDSDSEWNINKYKVSEESDVSNHQGHPQYENDSFQNQNVENYDDPEAISTSRIRNHHKGRQSKTYSLGSQQVQNDEPAEIILNDENTSYQQKSNKTKNFPSQMGRLIINNLKQKYLFVVQKSKKYKKLNLKVPKGLNDINKLIIIDDIRDDVTQYFEGDQILFDVLSSSKLIDPSNVIEAFAPYHYAFKQNKELQNQTW